jgi:predicted O-methyltransferase YrrM
MINLLNGCRRFLNAGHRYDSSGFWFTSVHEELGGTWFNDRMKIIKGFAWLSDVTQVLVFDRLNSKRRRFSELASTSCRELKFHSRAKIHSLPLAQVIAMLTPRSFEQVSLPGPFTDLSDVGSMNIYHVLGSLVRSLEPKTILEFGTYLGVSTQTMALNAPANCRIYTVDLPDEAQPEAIPQLNRIDQLHIRKSRHRVGEAFLHSSTRRQITQIRVDSMKFQAGQDMGKVDLVFVDGGHSLPIIKSDTENAFNILSTAGTVIWDDYFHMYPDVVQFLNELQTRLPLCGITGTNLVIHSRRFVSNSVGSKPAIPGTDSGELPGGSSSSQGVREDRVAQLP